MTGGIFELFTDKNSNDLDLMKELIDTELKQ